MREGEPRGVWDGAQLERDGADAAGRHEGRMPRGVTSRGSPCRLRHPPPPARRPSSLSCRWLPAGSSRRGRSTGWTVGRQSGGGGGGGGGGGRHEQKEEGEGRGGERKRTDQHCSEISSRGSTGPDGREEGKKRRGSSSRGAREAGTGQRRRACAALAQSFAWEGQRAGAPPAARCSATRRCGCCPAWRRTAQHSTA